MSIDVMPGRGRFPLCSRLIHIRPYCSLTQINRSQDVIQVNSSFSRDVLFCQVRDCSMAQIAPCKCCVAEREREENLEDEVQRIHVFDFRGYDNSWKVSCEVVQIAECRKVC